MTSAREFQTEIRDAVFAIQCAQRIPYPCKVWVNPDDWRTMLDDAEEQSVGPPLHLPAPAVPLPDGIVGRINGAFVYFDAALARGKYRIQEYREWESTP